MSIFVEAFFDELSKLAAEKDETEYRPTTRRQILLDQLKHLGYGAAGSVAGGLVGGLGGSQKSVNIGAALGGLAGGVYSRTRMRKRMARNLARQGLDAKTMAKLEESGVLKPRFSDVLGSGGLALNTLGVGGPMISSVGSLAGGVIARQRANKEIREKLKEYGKKTRGIMGFGLSDPD